jgi:hypothetical protein
MLYKRILNLESLDPFQLIESHTLAKELWKTKYDQLITQQRFTYSHLKLRLHVICH